MNILFVGGGSGGHFYPCLTFLKYCQEKNDNCFFLGAKNKYEEKHQNLISCKYKFIELSGFNNSLKSGVKIIKSYYKNKRIIKDFLKINKIDKIILFGNFESLIVGTIAYQEKIPYFIHEQNSSLGRSNNLLQKNTCKIFTTFNETENIKHQNKVIRVGNPRMIKKFHKYQNKKILVLMGSLGSSSLFDKINSILLDISDIYDITIVLGENLTDELNNTNIKYIKYFDTNVNSYNDYDLIITRAGATTLSEIASFALPCIIIPSPNVINNHQEKNAIEFIKEASGIMIKEENLTKNKLINEINKFFLDKTYYFNTQIKLYNFAVSNVCERMYKEIHD